MAKTSNLIEHFENQSFESKDVLTEFSKEVHLNQFFSNLDFLSTKCDIVEFNDTRWDKRPDTFCNDYYGEPYFYPVILLVNNIPSVFEFVPDNFRDRNVMVPTQKSIIDVLSLTRL